MLPMKNIFLYVPLIITSAFFSSGCKTVVGILNSNSVSSEDERLHSISENRDNLKFFNDGDFILNLTKKNIDSLLIPTLTNLVNQDKKIAHVKSHKITNVSTPIDKEQINIVADAQVTLDTLNASIDCKIIGTVTFVIRNDSLVLFPAFKYIYSVPQFLYRYLNHYICRERNLSECHNEEYSVHS